MTDRYPVMLPIQVSEWEEILDGDEEFVRLVGRLLCHQETGSNEGTSDLAGPLSDRYAAALLYAAAILLDHKDRELDSARISLENAVVSAHAERGRWIVDSIGDFESEPPEGHEWIRKTAPKIPN